MVLPGLDTTPDHQKFSALSQELDVFPPVLFLDGRMQAGDDARCAEEFAVLAGAIAELTRHPDPPVDALIRDPAGCEVLRDLLLEGDVRIDPLLGDLVGLEAGPPPDWLGSHSGTLAETKSAWVIEVGYE